MGVVDAECPDALLAPVEYDAAQLVPHLPPVCALEVERVNVFVLFRGVLCVLDGAVGPAPEPLGVRLDVWMVRRGLESDIKCDLDVVVPGFLHEASEIIECA